MKKHKRFADVFGDVSPVGLDVMEGRELLSANIVDVALDPSGNLSIAGTAGNDSIQVIMQDTPSGMKTQVRTGGVKVTLPDVVNRINVQGNSGNDKIDFSVFGMARSIPIEIDAGDGKDKVNFLAVGAYQSAGWIYIQGGEDSDQILADSDTPLYIGGGKGDDVLTLGDKLIWSPTHTVSGDEGNDIITNLSASYAYLYGGADNDVMFGGDFGNYFDAGAGKNVVYGGLGGDIFGSSSGGQDKIWGGNGSDGLYIHRVFASTEITFDGGPGFDYVNAYDLSILFAPKFNLFNIESMWQINSDGGGKG